MNATYSKAARVGEGFVAESEIMGPGRTFGEFMTCSSELAYRGAPNSWLGGLAD
jgi:hypothetical protein